MSSTTVTKHLGINGVWISKDGTTHHYHINHSSICGLSDILRDISNTHDTSENPDTKCTICKGILKSKQCFNIGLEKFRNDAKESKFLLKYKTSPVDFLTRYLNSPENAAPTLEELQHNILKEFSEINMKDVLADAIVRGNIIYKEKIVNGEIDKNGKFYSTISEAMTL